MSEDSETKEQLDANRMKIFSPQLEPNVQHNVLNNKAKMLRVSSQAKKIMLTLLKNGRIGFRKLLLQIEGKEAFYGYGNYVQSCLETSYTRTLRTLRRHGWVCVCGKERDMGAYPCYAYELSPSGVQKAEQIKKELKEQLLEWQLFLEEVEG